MKKVLTMIVLLLLTIALVLSACKPATPDQTEGPDKTEASKPDVSDPDASQADPPKDFKIAIVLPGPITDTGFSGPAYEGVKRFGEEYNVPVAYRDLAEPADYDTIFRGYAEEGYNLIIGHGNQFFETASQIAEEYPDLKFAVTSAPKGNGTNLASLRPSSQDVGFLVGALCGMMTKNNKIAMVSGSEIPPLIAVLNGTIVGAKYVNPDAEVVNVYTGNVDAAKVKEAALALLDAGCDILSQTADKGSIGAITACQERGIYNVATSADFAPQAPDTVLSSVMVLNDIATYTAAKMVYEGTFEGIVYPFGIREDAVVMTGYGQLEDKIPQEVKDKMAKLIKDIKDGVISTEDLYEEYKEYYENK